jgi:hypothetical protein
MFEEDEKRDFIQNNRDPYKEEIKIPPPHPVSFLLKGSIFSLSSRMTT